MLCYRGCRGSSQCQFSPGAGGGGGGSSARVEEVEVCSCSVGSLGPTSQKGGCSDIKLLLFRWL